jgi:hypothetical protein
MEQKTISLSISILFLFGFIGLLIWHGTATYYYSKNFRIVRMYDNYYVEQLVIVTHLYFFKKYEYKYLNSFKTESEAYDYVVKKETETENEVIYQTKNLIK